MLRAMADADLYNLEFLSSVTKITQEIDNHLDSMTRHWQISSFTWSAFELLHSGSPRAPEGNTARIGHPLPFGASDCGPRAVPLRGTPRA